MNPTSHRFVLFPLLAAALASSAQAALIVSESFDYAGPTLADANGGTGFPGAWSSSRTDSIVAGLTDARSASAGGGSGGAVLVSVNTAGRVWDGTDYGDNGDVIWFSMLMSTAAEGFDKTFTSRMMLFSNGPSMGSSNGFGFQLTTTGNLVAKIAGTSSSTVATYTPAQANFVLGRYTNSTAGNDSLDLWVNPSAGALTTFNATGVLADLGTVSSSVSVATANVTFTANSGVYLRADSNTPASYWTADELRIGTSFADVAAVPEPSATAALAGLAGLGFVLARRRRG
jgi:hypothetical protein